MDPLAQTDYTSLGCRRGWWGLQKCQVLITPVEVRSLHFGNQVLLSQHRVSACPGLDLAVLVRTANHATCPLWKVLQHCQPLFSLSLCGLKTVIPTTGCETEFRRQRISEDKYREYRQYPSMTEIRGPGSRTRLNTALLWIAKSAVEWVAPRLPTYTCSWGAVHEKKSSNLLACDALTVASQSTKWSRWNCTNRSLSCRSCRGEVAGQFSRGKKHRDLLTDSWQALALQGILWAYKCACLRDGKLLNLKVK